MMSAKNLTLLAGLAAISFAGVANADTAGPFTASFPSSTTEINGTLLLPKFNVPGAILDSISLSATANATNSGTLTNTAAQQQTFTINFSTDVTLTGPASITLDPTPSTSQKFTNLAPSTPTTYGPKTGTDTKSATPGVADFALYTGAGNFSLAFASLSGQGIVGGGGNIVSSVNTVADVNATVIYTYHRVSGVPEPGSVAMMIAGGITGAGFFVRRRRSSK